MNLGKTSLGLVVVFIGIFILLDNLDILTFDWLAVVYFWPVLIILIGINILLPKKMEGQILSIMATVIVLLFFAYQGLKTSENKWNLNESEEVVTERGQISLLSRDYDEKINYAELNISGGAVGYKISETTNKLVDIEASSSLSSFSLSSILTNGKAVLDFTQKGTEEIRRKRLGMENRANIQLNAEPIWDINLKIGAGTADFNLKSFKIRNLEIDGGVSAIKIIMGMPAEEISKIDFEGGMSSLDIHLPEQVACVIHVESALSSLKFPGFVKQDNGTYRSDNYNESLKRIEIKLENGLSSIKVTRYN
jgi:hypothetical protein